MISKREVKANEFYKAEATEYSLRGLTATGTINTDETKFTCAAKREYFGKVLAIWIDEGDGLIKPNNFIGFYRVTDIGSEKIASGEVLDIYEADVNKAREFGRKKVIYQVIESEG